MSRVPQKHRELLEEEIVGLKPSDEFHVLQRLDKMSAQFNKSTGKSLYDELMHNIDALHLLLRDRKDMDDRQRRVAVAACKYFVKDDDLVHEDHPAGLVDDALVVLAAMEELAPLFEGS